MKTVTWIHLMVLVLDLAFILQSSGFSTLVVELIIFAFAFSLIVLGMSRLRDSVFLNSTGIAFHVLVIGILAGFGATAAAGAAAVMFLIPAVFIR
jgi:hypothetical protein